MHFVHFERPILQSSGAYLVSNSFAGAFEALRFLLLLKRDFRDLKEEFTHTLEWRNSHQS